MGSNKRIAVMCGVLFIVAIGFYYIGFGAAYNRIDIPKRFSDTQTFYATITNINDSNFKVNGLSVNSIHYRGAFTFSISEATTMEWRGTEISVSDFDKGDTIAITFSGEIMEIYPARIIDVVRIQLLDDEK